jgi:tRNA(Ile)-lysidine synthase
MRQADSMTQHGPITADEARSLITAAVPGWGETDGSLAVGCSGGPDSLALALLAAVACPGRVHVLIVDHGLRAESPAEAAQTLAWLAAKGIPADILVWTGDKPASGIQAAARDARYRLLLDGCQRLNAGILLLAHHLDDQAETFLMAVGRGAGLNGLAGMAMWREQNGISIVRPLLGIPKARLIATLEQLGQPWIDDPGNGNTRFDRVRLRQQMAALAGAGLTPDVLAGAAVRLADVRTLMDDLQNELSRKAAGEPGQKCRIALAELEPYLGSVAARRVLLVPLLADMIRVVSGLKPRFDELSRVIDWLAMGEGPSVRTLGRCRLTRSATDLLVEPE